MMNLVDGVWWILVVLASSLGLVIIVYLVARGASIAYFRSKYEHHLMLRGKFNKSKKEDDYGAW